MADTKALREAIKQCFVNSFMEHDGELELFDTEKTIELLEELITAQKIAARIEHQDYLRNQRRLLIENTNLENRPDAFQSGFIAGMDELLAAGLPNLNRLKERG